MVGGEVAWLAVGSGLTRPPLFGLLSILTPSNEQGATLGVAQSAGSLARVIGPLWAGFAYDHLGKTVPFFTSAALVGGTILLWRGVSDGRAEPAPVAEIPPDTTGEQVAS